MEHSHGEIKKNSIFLKIEPGAAACEKVALHLLYSGRLDTYLIITKLIMELKASHKGKAHMFLLRCIRSIDT